MFIIMIISLYICMYILARWLYGPLISCLAASMLDEPLSAFHCQLLSVVVDVVVSVNITCYATDFQLLDVK